MTKPKALSSPEDPGNLPLNLASTRQLLDEIEKRCDAFVFVSIWKGPKAESSRYPVVETSKNPDIALMHWLLRYGTDSMLLETEVEEDLDGGDLCSEYPDDVSLKPGGKKDDDEEEEDWEKEGEEWKKK